MLIEFYNKIFNINLSDYENIGGNFPINKILFLITVALCVAYVIIELQKKSSQDVVKQLTRHEANTEESAVTLEEIGLHKAFLVKMLLKSDTSFLSRLVKRVGKVEYTYEEYVELQKAKKLPKETIDFSTARFYLDVGQEERRKHITDSYTPSILRMVLLCLLMLVIYICIALAMPEILSFINSSLASTL